MLIQNISILKFNQNTWPKLIYSLQGYKTASIIYKLRHGTKVNENGQLPMKPSAS